MSCPRAGRRPVLAPHGRAWPAGVASSVWSISARTSSRAPEASMPSKRWAAIRLQVGPRRVEPDGAEAPRAAAAAPSAAARIPTRAPCSARPHRPGRCAGRRSARSAPRCPGSWAASSACSPRGPNVTSAARASVRATGSIGRDIRQAVAKRGKVEAGAPAEDRQQAFRMGLPHRPRVRLRATRRHGPAPPRGRTPL